jgi:hypothetical protein
MFVCLDFEKQIQTNEIIHEALTNRSMAVRKRSPLSPAATQTTFRVIIRQTTSVNNVEIAILESFSGEGELGLGRSRVVEEVVPDGVAGRRLAPISACLCQQPKQLSDEGNPQTRPEA